MNFDHDQRTGLDVFKQITALDRGIDVVMITGETDPRRIFELVNSGVHRFIPKPADVSEIRSTVVAILEERDQRKRQLSFQPGMGGSTLIGSSPQMQQVREQISRLVTGGARDILIQGETGTGKEVVARHISQLADPLKPMVALNCAAMNENLIQSELFGHIKGAFTGADRLKLGAFESAGGGYASSGVRGARFSRFSGDRVHRVRMIERGSYGGSHPCSAGEPQSSSCPLFRM